MGSALLLLVAVLFIGTRELGARRWLPLGPISFQPAEFAKFALVLHVSAMCAKRQELMGDLRKGLMPILLWAFAAVVLIAKQPNMSTASVLVLITFGILYIAQMPLKYIITAGGLAAVGGVIFALTATYRVQRMLAFVGHHTSQTDKVTYQLDQALLAFGNGGLFGVGIGQSKQSMFFLPESYGDFIYSVIAEELGLIGAVITLVCFCVIAWRGFKVAANAPDPFGSFLALGLTTMVALQALINISVVLSLMPTKGIPLPLVSSGGSSLLINLVGMGVLLNVSQHASTEE